MAERIELLKGMARRGRYAPLHEFLLKQEGDAWKASFAQIEQILGFTLPNSARIHRPWWANQGGSGGHSHALAWEMAGWKTSQVRMDEEAVTFVRSEQ